MSKDKKTILYVEDEVIPALAGEKVLKKIGYDVIIAETGEKAIDIAISNNDINLIIMDINLGKGIDGTDAASQILNKKKLPIVFLTSHTEKKILDRLKKITPYGFVIKNTGDHILQLAIDTAFKLFEAHTTIQDRDYFNRLIVETANEGILSIDENDIIKYANRKMTEMLGYSTEEITGKPFTDFMAQEEKVNHIKIMADRRNGKSGFYERIFIHKDGSRIWAQVSSTPIFSADGTFVGSFGMFTDISVQKQIEQNLVESELRYKMVSEIASDYFFELGINVNGEILLNYVSDKFYDITGLSKNEPVSFESFIGMLFEDDRSLAVETFNKIISCREAKDLECRSYNKEKNVQWINIVARSNWDELEKRATSVFGVIKDITKRKYTEKALKESEVRFKSMIDLAADAILIGNMKGEIIEPNICACTLTGYERSELIGQNMRFLFSKEERKRSPFKYDQLNQGLTVREERFLTCKDGSIIPVEMTTKIMPDKTFQSMIRDMTEWKLAEKKLMESEARARSYIDNAPYGVFIVNEKGKFLKVNIAACRISEYTAEELLTMKVPDLMVKNITKSEINYYHQLADTGLASGEFACKQKGGSIKYWSIDTVKLSPTRFIGFVMDVTELKQAAEALRESEEKYRLIFDFTPIGLLSFDNSGQITACNDIFVKIIGSTREKLIGLNMLNLPDKNIVSAVKKALNGTTGFYEDIYHSVTADKSTPVRVIFTPKNSVEGNVLGGVGIIEDITERMKAEKEIIEKNLELTSMNEELFTANMELEKATNELKQSKEIAESYLNVAAELIISIDTNGTIILLNESGHKLLGYENKELIGKNWFDTAIPLDTRKEVYGYFKKIINEEIGNILSNENKIITKTGEEKLILWHNTLLKDARGKISGTLSSGEDITEKQILIETAQKHHKIESLGVMAGGIAHDFNNLLGGIYGYIDLARSSAKDPETKEYLEGTLNTMNRARGLTQQLLTFAKGGAPVRKVERLFPFIQETVQFALSGSNVSCIFDIPENIWMCNLDRNQIGQVIDNLVINAQQAMPMGGNIEVKVQNISFNIKKHPILSGEKYVKITIKDFGIGIPPEIRNRIFDPFFTTKVKGHGLGLATSYSIISRHEGIIDVESETGKWSAFHIYLPAADEEVLMKSEKKSSMQKGSGTIVVMDDEESIRNVVESMLKALGYTVILAKDGNEALNIINEEYKSKRKITGIILDLTVPGGMGGKAAIVEIRKIDSNVPVFVSSGYAEDPIMSSPAEYGFTDSLCKPFMIADLAELLNKYLNK